jgi:ankyrin repeat protein
MALVLTQGSQAANESLWEAARAGDTTRITAALAQSADVNARSRYDVTPLIFAAGNGRLDAMKLLLSRGAGPKHFLFAATDVKVKAVQHAVEDRYE